MSRRPEPVQVVKERRDAALDTLVGGLPYLAFLGIRFERRGDELTAVLPFRDENIGNPLLPALHGGVTAAFLETAAVVELAWSQLWPQMEGGAGAAAPGVRPPLPRTIDFTVDFLRSGLPRDAYARAVVVRQGRRYASVRVEGWQDNRARLFAQASGHFMMPDLSAGPGAAFADDEAMDPAPPASEPR
ncbi:PaaI family thioesterase [Mesobaculum littorinae]|uniref:PaaI family thioesterase n=1 Tax=Mesobaculum littorinae TaxID=2486419 RepID=A0A438AIA8_9RHOB|nr:PaaI family thioesterase [Mesobaculum littorinae]RVV98439.1 PaaI family thioesterase [Mesobaculum littorinae]